MSEKIEPVARYSISLVDCEGMGDSYLSTKQSPRGEWVKSADHATTVSALEARCERLMEALANAESGIASLFESGDWGMADDTIYQGFAILEDIRGSVPEVKDWTSPALTGATQP